MMNQQGSSNISGSQPGSSGMSSDTARDEPRPSEVSGNLSSNHPGTSKMPVNIIKPNTANPAVIVLRVDSDVEQQQLQNFYNQLPVVEPSNRYPMTERRRVLHNNVLDNCNRATELCRRLMRMIANEDPHIMPVAIELINVMEAMDDNILFPELINLMEQELRFLSWNLNLRQRKSKQNLLRSLRALIIRMRARKVVQRANRAAHAARAARVLANHTAANANNAGAANAVNTAAANTVNTAAAAGTASAAANRRY